jgi:pyruvate,orthophosphate dikinase
MSKWVYFFGAGEADGGSGQEALLGGKGANLAEMCRLGVPVPPGFTLSTEACNAFTAAGALPPGLEAQLDEHLARVEAIMGARFGDPQEPLLLSVRSGARRSMPGMMDSVLNLGLNETVVQGLARRTGHPRFAWDTYRRFLAMFADVVHGLGREAHGSAFERMLDEAKRDAGARSDLELDAAALRALAGRYRDFVAAALGRPFPDDPREQLLAAVGAVFRSWNNDRARAYRAMYGIPEDWGTAANVQAMVFGNLGDDCATGVAFTRDPATGERRFYGEYLVDAQGEDVVAGVRTPAPVPDSDHGHEGSMARRMPEAYAQLVRIQGELERHFRDMQDIEFTVQQGRLWILQTRNGKRTGFAAVRTAVDMVDEGLIDTRDAVARIEPEAITQLMRPVFDREALAQARAAGRVLARALPAGPGAASGRIALGVAEALAMAAQGGPVILVRPETSADDIRGMQAAQGVLTARGGMTSHAAVVGRQMGKVCVVGCAELEVDPGSRRLVLAGRPLAAGDWLSLDGYHGEVIAGELPTRPSEVLEVLLEGRDPAQAPVYDRFSRLLQWADGLRRLKVRANADQGTQGRLAAILGAEGIGLCRTEHMFFGEGKIGPMRRVILAEAGDARDQALEELLALQRADFTELFRACDGFPVTVRMLDPPLHEFLPGDDDAVCAVAAEMGRDAGWLRGRIEGLRESNPMLGHRGCRLGITRPEITAMQTRAVLEAALDVRAEGVGVMPELMIPLVAFPAELAHQCAVVRTAAERLFASRGERLRYLVGTMIELPRAALLADAIAAHADFFSFGTNDLTQTTLGMSRDDIGPVLRHYRDAGLLAADPFQQLDEAGVGALVRIAVDKGRGARPDLEVGICGEHGGDPGSIDFCHRAGLDYVSCAPLRVPVARLAAAQAALRHAHEV